MMALVVHPLQSASRCPRDFDHLLYSINVNININTSLSFSLPRPVVPYRPPPIVLALLGQVSWWGANVSVTAEHFVTLRNRNTQVRVGIGGERLSPTQCRPPVRPRNILRLIAITMLIGTYTV